MKYSVPQFIDVEDKIFGPFTFRQFIYLLGGGGSCYLLYKLLPFWISIFLIIPIASLAGALAFIKMNGMPFINILESAFTYLVKRKLYLWKKDETLKVKKEEVVETKKESYLPRISESKLHDISWGLDVLTKDTSETSKK